MTIRRLAVDAVVVGAGTAGANAALQLARRGLRVVIVERRSMAAAGARWCNSVLPLHFERAGIAVPTGAEVRSPSGGRAFMFGPDVVRPVVVDDVPAVEADMRLLVERLIAGAQAEGVRVLERCSDLSVEQRWGRIDAIVLHGAEPGGTPGPVRLTAPLFVDASGRQGTLRSQSETLAPWCPRVQPGSVCTATQFVFGIADPEGMRRFLDRHGAEPGDSLTWVGFAGGFSAIAVRVEPSCEEASVLTGTLATGVWGSGKTILDRVRAEQPWLGATVFGGSGLIPLRRPYSRFTAPGLALVGDAAAQVFPAHGSGIGIGLVAGTMLAEAVDGADDPGSAATLWSYQAAFQREHGGTLAAYDTFRRLTSAIGTDGVRRMFASGLFSAERARGGLEQRWREPTRTDLADGARAFRSDPGLGARMMPGLVRSAAAVPLYRRHPRTPDTTALTRWDRAVRLAIG